MKKMLVVWMFLLPAFFANADDHSSSSSIPSRERISEVSISPDGRFLALVASNQGMRHVVVVDRSRLIAPKIVMKLDPKQHTAFKWCAWAKPDRIVCNVTSTEDGVSFEDAERQLSEFGDFRSDLMSKQERGGSRMIAFDRDGANLNTFSRLAIKYWGLASWLRDDPDHILVLLPEDISTTGLTNLGSTVEFGGVLPRVYRCNVRSGEIEKAVSPANRTGLYGLDARGDVRLVVHNKLNEKGIELFAKASKSKEWKKIPLSHSNGTDGPHHLYPQTVAIDSDYGYAIGDYKGHEALWKIDLTGSKDIQLVFSVDGVDVGTVLGPDRQLLGLVIHDDKNTIKYFDARAQLLQDTINRSFPKYSNRLVDFSRDMKIAVVQSRTDGGAILFYVLDMSAHPARLSLIGNS